MNFLSLVGIEFKKIHRFQNSFDFNSCSHYSLVPSIFNANLNFGMQAEGISPENNFFIQGFMGMAWFMFPGKYGCEYGFTEYDREKQ